MSGQNTKANLSCHPTFADLLIIFLPPNRDCGTHSTKRFFFQMAAKKCLSSNLLWIKMSSFKQTIIITIFQKAGILLKMAPSLD